MGNWGEGLQEKFDFIISNPPRVATADLPYLLPEMRNYDPQTALDGGHDGLKFFYWLAKNFPDLVKPEGYGLFQVGEKYASAAKHILNSSGLFKLETKLNYLGIPNAILANPCEPQTFWQLPRWMKILLR